MVKIKETNGKLEEQYLDIEIVSFNIHMPFNAMMLFEKGHKDIDEVLKNLDANKLRVTSSSCPKLINKYDELVRVYKKDLGNMNYLEDIIMTDGGSYYSFTFQKTYASTNFSTAIPTKKIISALDDLVKEANDCTRNSIKLPSMIER